MCAFDHLPLAATINHKFLCVHGGLSPDISLLKDIADLNRHREPPREGPFCDLLWADPYDENKKAKADDENTGRKRNQPPTTWFSYNETRQCSYVWGLEATKQFLSRNKLQAIIRAHEVQDDGYRFCMSKGATPRVITIFSAPNYCDVYKNKGACLQFVNDQIKIRQFCSSPHPYYLPNFMDVFTWSLPFMSEKVIDMVYHMLEWGRDDKDDESSIPDSMPSLPTPTATGEEHTDGIDSLMAKLNALARFRMVAQTLKNEKEKIVKLKALSPSKNLPSGLLFEGSEAIDQALDKFESVRQHDLAMEAMPTLEGKPGVPGKINRTLSGRSFTFTNMADMLDMEIGSDIEEGRQRRFAVTIEDVDEEYFV